MDKFLLNQNLLKSNYWLQALVLNDSLVKYKNFILKDLNTKGYGCRPAWSLIHKLKIYKNSPRMKLEVTQQLYKNNKYSQQFFFR